MWNGLGQHTNATQTSRAIASLYALIGDFDRQGGNVNFPKVPVNDVGGKEFLPKEADAIRVGRERKPLGPPAKPGNCAAYDIFNAILDEQPYPIKALLNFGSNTIMSNADSRRGREAMKALEFGVAADLFMTPTAELCDYVLPATSFLEMSNITTAFEHRREGKTHLQYRSAVVEPWLSAAPTPGLFLNWRSDSVSANISGMATSKRATPTSFSQAASRWSNSRTLPAVFHYQQNRHTRSTRKNPPYIPL